MAGRIIDISPEIHSATGVFPGDTKYQRKVAMSFAQGHHLTLSSIETTLHIGAHADAPNHYGSQGCDIASRPLESYIGACQVISVQVGRGQRISPDDISDKIVAPRVLFHTGTFPDPDQWNSDFASLSPELIDHLAGKGVLLVGIDTPSIDPEDSKQLESHQAILKNDMAILEGLVLSHVKPGPYELVALPLKLRDADASPVRAILIER